MGTPIRDQQIWLGALKLEGELNSIDLNVSLDALDDTRLGNASVKNAVGRGSVALQLGGFWDPVGAAAADAQLFSDLGETLAYIIDVTGSGEGGLAYFGDILAQARPFQGQHGQQAGMTIAGATRTSLPVRGALSEVSSGIGSGTVNGTGINAGAVSADQKLYAALCLTAETSASVDVIIQSDADNSWATPITRISFTNRTAVGSEFLSVAGAITDEWFRAVVTVNSGSGVSLAVALGVQ